MTAPVLSSGASRWLRPLAALLIVAASATASVLAAGAVGSVALSPGSAGSSGSSEYTGGAATVFSDGRTAFSFPAANLSDPERTRFVIGNSFFRRNWVQAPSSTRARDGLGPHFVARSCGGCHVQDGRGAPPGMRDGRNIEAPVALLFRLSVPGEDGRGGPKPDRVYGDQFANAAVRGVKPEGRVEIRSTAINGTFADGMTYQLQAPEYRFTDLQYGPMAEDLMVSPRIAPQVIGIGLLEAIPEAEILRNAADQQRAGGPVKGKPNQVWDAFAGKMMLGRFGWKANVATIAHQVGGAFRGDIGITSSHFPDEACTAAQADCVTAPHGGTADGAPEIDDETFGQVVFYDATLAPPARRHLADPVVKAGEALFHEAGCAVCHRPSYRTGEPPLADRFPQFSSPALVGQTIWPYTDLLLHDLGDGLADGRPDYAANGHQWRTPPLWGIGMIESVNGHRRLLHDGRARGVLEAILWHDGEARASRDRVRALSANERHALVRFVESL